MLSEGGAQLTPNQWVPCWMRSHGTKYAILECKSSTGKCKTKQITLYQLVLLCFGVLNILLRSSMAYFVPCDLILKRTYCLCRNQINHVFFSARSQAKKIQIFSSHLLDSLTFFRFPNSLQTLFLMLMLHFRRHKQTKDVLEL